MTENNSIVSRYINKITEKAGNNSYIYRGQSQDYEGGVTSTALRRFKKSGRSEPTKEEYFEYHRDLIKDANSYHYGESLNGTELLIDLQHYGAATGLIDFSKDFLVALWFACNNADEDGKVFLFNVWSNDKCKHLEPGTDLFKQDDCQEHIYYLQTNFKSNNRIFAQKGVFVFGHQDINTHLDSITINKHDKPTILKELQQYFNIDEKALFQDMYGFAQVNNAEHKLNIKTELDYFEEAYEEKENLAKKISLYQKAIAIKSGFHEAYYNMGFAYDELSGKDNLEHAIKAYQDAIAIKPDMHGAYYNMGTAYKKLKQFDEALTAYDQAVTVNPASVNHTKAQNWDDLTAWVEALDDSATKQKYQAILNKLKGG